MKSLKSGRARTYSRPGSCIEIWRGVCPPPCPIACSTPAVNVSVTAETDNAMYSVSYIAWALKRGFLTAKAARPDVYRAANNILRMALEGRLRLCLCPPDYTLRQGQASCACLSITELLSTYKLWMHTACCIMVSH